MRPNEHRFRDGEEIYIRAKKEEEGSSLIMRRDIEFAD